MLFWTDSFTGNNRHHDPQMAAPRVWHKLVGGGRNGSSRSKASRFVLAVDRLSQPPDVIPAGSDLTASCARDVSKMQSLINDPCNQLFCSNSSASRASASSFVECFV